MTYLFGSEFRDRLAESCADFPRVSQVNPELKRAAVAITLVAAGDDSLETSFLLTRRASKMRAHPGQYALPGGRCDITETCEMAALRELSEELGIHVDSKNVLGVLDDYVTRSGYVITPVIVWLDDDRELFPNSDEVASVHRIRLADIAPDDAVEFITIPESSRPVIRVRMDGTFVHAPTAALIYQLRELVAGRITRVAHFEQPLFAWK